MRYLDFKRFSIYYDPYLIISITLLSILGLFFLYSASDGNASILIKQSIFVFFGLILMVMLSQPDPQIYYSYSGFFLLISIILVFIAIFFGPEINGANRWISFGFVTLQPSELCKVFLPIFIASYLYGVNLPINLKNTFLTIFLIFIVFFIISSQPDLGTAIVILLSGLYVLFLAGLSWTFIGSALAIFIISLPFLWNNFLQPFQQQRIQTLLDPGADPYGSGWNITQSKIAIGSGGISGKGYTDGSQSHLDFLPETETDFIFAVIAEEFGFIGICVLLSIYFFILLRCLYLAFNARDRFCRLTIGGLSLIFASTLFINLAMVTGLIPVVGMPLPLISKGGSSLLSFYIAFGIIISMASHKKLMQR
jgi:rod shape determining protein RodA